MRFMDVRALDVLRRATAIVSRSGYTGEDGFEISVPADDGGGRSPSGCSTRTAVLPIGLGARDSLRLEAGLCLYGHDIDTDDDAGRGGARMGDPEGPAQRRRARRRFPGAGVILGQLETGAHAPPRRPEARGPGAGARGHRALRRTADGEPIGAITSGGFGPSVDAPGRHGLRPDVARAPGHALSRRGARQDAAGHRRRPALRHARLQTAEHAASAEIAC